MFNFKNITQSQPLALGNSVSDTQILIGGGFAGYFKNGMKNIAAKYAALQTISDHEKHLR